MYDSLNLGHECLREDVNDNGENCLLIKKEIFENFI